MKTSTIPSLSGIKSIAASLLLMTLLFTSTLTHATDIANSPLFLSNSVQPNLFFMLDDSGSMGWEFLPNDLPSYKEPAWGSPRTNLNNHNGASDEDKLLLCRGYNPLMYDPNVLYTPWRGKDINGIDYTNAIDMAGGSYTQIRNNPYCPSGVTTGACSNADYRDTTNLTDETNFYTYFPWNDTDADGVYDAAECSTTPADGLRWSDLATTGTTNVPAAMQQSNYANWFSYYRKRDYVMKRAISELVHSSRHRMGMATLHNKNDVGTPISNVDDKSLPIDSAAQTAKESLLTQISRIYPESGTPLQIALRDSGDYYKGDNSNGAIGRLFPTAPSHTNTINPNSPILDADNGGECQQNFTIMLTDGYYQNYSTAIANADGDGNTTFDGGTYGDTYSNTLGDIAMHYYENDLAASLTDLVPVITGVDEASHQHMVTFTVAFGVKGSLDPDTQNPTDTGFSWPDPLTSQETKIDDLWHSAYNGRGQFLSASNGQGLIKAFEDALTNINQRIGSASAVAVSSGSVSTETRLYQSTFDSGNWEGHLYALQFTSSGIVDSTDWGTTLSDAGEVLKGQNWDSGREIITWNPDATTPDGAAFRWADIGASNQTALIDTATAVIGQERLEFIRGDHSNELKGGTGSYRSRGAAGLEFKLGDIVHSSPLYVGSPPYAYVDSLEGVSYNDFRVNNFERKAMIYVGANDGMLHAFDATTGEERLAYVPSAVYKNLPALADPAYTHQYYVDETPVAGDVFYSGAWHTVLLGSLRAGGRSVFALDISDPLPYTDSKGTGHSYAANFNESNAANIALWEYSDVDLGLTFGKPSIGRMANGKWVAVFSNGYNNSIAPPGDTSACGTTYSCTGYAYLYFVDIETGTLIKKISTDVGTVTNPNGLSEPSLVDDDGDNIIDLVYAGDLYGNMWKFDVTAANDSSWGVAKASAGKPAPLFTATDDANDPQPITAAPEITDAVPGIGGLMVYFGSGRYLGKSDITSPQMQSFYGIWDKIGVGAEDNSQVGMNDLLEQTITQYDDTGANADAPNQDNAVRRSLSNTAIETWGSTGSPTDFMGWKVDFDSTTTGFSGESVIYKALAWNNNIVFGTLVPEDKPCGAGLTGWIMALNRDNGGPPDEDFFPDTDDDPATAACAGTVCGGMRVTDGGGLTPLIIDGDTSQLDASAGGGGGGGSTPPARNCDNIKGSMIIPDTSGSTPDILDTKRAANLCRQTWREL